MTLTVTARYSKRLGQAPRENVANALRRGRISSAGKLKTSQLRSKACSRTGLSGPDPSKHVHLI